MGIYADNDRVTPPTGALPQAPYFERMDMIQTSLLMDHKIAQALDRIKAFEPPEGYYVAFSGGKDSIVVLDLVRKAGVKHDTHMNLTSVDPPELIKYVKQYYPDVQRHRPKENMWQLIERKMYPPTMKVRYCCEALKEGGGAGRFVITGVRWAESQKRARRTLTATCTRNGETKRYLRPIIDWSDNEVWEYININNLPYCSLYDEGFTRIGCIGCPFAGKHRSRDFQRWPRFEKLWRRAMHKAAARRRKIGWVRSKYETHESWTTDGDLMWKYWMDDSKHGTPDEAQCVLFE